MWLTWTRGDSTAAVNGIEILSRYQRPVPGTVSQGDSTWSLATEKELSDEQIGVEIQWRIGQGGGYMKERTYAPVSVNRLPLSRSCPCNYKTIICNKIKNLLLLVLDFSHSCS